MFIRTTADLGDSDVEMVAVLGDEAAATTYLSADTSEQDTGRQRRQYPPCDPDDWQPGGGDTRALERTQRASRNLELPTRSRGIQEWQTQGWCGLARRKHRLVVLGYRAGEIGQ